MDIDLFMDQVQAYGIARARKYRGEPNGTHTIFQQIKADLVAADIGDTTDIAALIFDYGTECVIETEFDGTYSFDLFEDIIARLEDLLFSRKLR
jgi:hypothetical protein